MKKIISIITLFTLLMTLVSFSAQAEEVPLDPMNNVLFDVVSQVKDVEMDDHDHGKLIDMRAVSDYPGATLIKIFEDGCRISHKVLEGDEYSGYIYMADTDFPAYLDEVSDTKFILEEEGSADGESMKWYYLIEIAPDGIKNNLIATAFSSFNEITKEREYTIKTFSTDENGQETETIAEGSPMNYDDYSDIVYGESTFNDGLIYKSSYTDDVDFSGYYDVTGACVWQDPHFDYYGMGYNLGYYIETSNNGGAIDWTQEDAVEQLRYSTGFINSVTQESYFFGNANIVTLFDSGYAVMAIKDDAGNETEYIIKLKIPAIPTVHLNGEKIKFDQIPVVENERILVPLRAIFEALGAEVSWDGAANTIIATKDGTEIKLTLGSTEAYKNGELINLDVPAKAENGRTLVPVRFIADSFGVGVDWNQADYQVILTQN